MKSVNGYEEYYSVTKNGGVYSHYRNRFRKAFKSQHGYLMVGLSKDGIQTKKSVHRLVAEVFIPNPDPASKKQINHRDGDKENNSKDNLEWCSSKENIQHALNNGLIDRKRIIKWGQKWGKINGNKYLHLAHEKTRKFNKEQIKNIRNKYQEGKTQKEIAKIYGATISCISLIINKKSYKCIA